MEGSLQQYIEKTRQLYRILTYSFVGLAAMLLVLTVVLALLGRKGLFPRLMVVLGVLSFVLAFLPGFGILPMGDTLAVLGSGDYRIVISLSLLWLIVPAVFMDSAIIGYFGIKPFNEAADRTWIDHVIFFPIMIIGLILAVVIVLLVIFLWLLKKTIEKVFEEHFS